MFYKSYALKFSFFIFTIFQLSTIYAQTNNKFSCDSLLKTGIKDLDKNKHTSSLELLFQARKIANNNKWYKQEFVALNNIGSNYYRLFEYGEALNYYNKAYIIATNKLTPNDEILVINNIAILYYEEKKYSQAKDYFNKVYTSAKEKTLIGAAAINLGTLYIEINKINDAKNYYNKALAILKEKPEYVVLAKGGLANCELLLGNTIKARQIAQDLLNNTKDLEFYHADVELLLIIAKSYLKDNNLDIATIYVNKILDKKPNLETKIKLFKMISEINIKKKSFQVALQYKDSLFDGTTKLTAIKNEKLFENSKIKFELQNYKIKSQLNEAKLVNERKIIYYVLFFITIIFFFILVTARNISLKLKQKKIIAESNQQILALELENKKRESLLLEKQIDENKTISLLQQEKLKNEVELKNRKLSAKALYLSGKNQMIEEILSELSNIPLVAKSTILLDHIKSLKSQLKADNEWDNFIIHFEEVNQGFLNSLQSKHSSLTINDIRYLSYIYMNLSTKEIASMLHITQESCRKRKERILTKMQLPKDTNLYDYLTII